MLESIASPSPLVKPCNQSKHPTLNPSNISQKHFTQSKNDIISSNSRRTITIATVSSILLVVREAIFKPEEGFCFDLRMTVPDQTVEEAESGIKTHAQDLLSIKELIELESWREAQKALRKSSSLLKQDIYTLIQAQPGNQRPLLRKLYSQLFNNVTNLDYAARGKDATLVQECYTNIVIALDDILSKL